MAMASVGWLAHRGNVWWTGIRTRTWQLPV